MSNSTIINTVKIIDPKWCSLLANEMQQDYFVNMKKFLKREIQAGKHIYPDEEEIFHALNLTYFDATRVVIIGQDPYHCSDQANGLAFSVKPGIKTPPSLHNIFKELHNDLNIPIPNHGCLQKWAQQGVLLLNTTLTVEANKPLSHAKIGWQNFTDKIIHRLNLSKQNLVFILWGISAQKKSEIIDSSKHYVLTAAHPSPLSAYRGFLGCKHFSKTNNFLQENGCKLIDWRL